MYEETTFSIKHIPCVYIHVIAEDELKGVVLSEDPGYVKEPLVAIQAEDGTGNWINGLIDQNSRVHSLRFSHFGRPKCGECETQTGG